MGLKQETGGGNGPKAIRVEFYSNSKLGIGGTLREYKGADAEPAYHTTLSGEIVNMYVQDPMKPYKGEPKPNAAKTPKKLNIVMEDEGQRYVLSVPLDTDEDKMISFSGMKAVATVYAACAHALTVKGANDAEVERANAQGGEPSLQPTAIQFRAGSTETGNAWLAARGGADFGQKIEKIWGFTPEGEAIVDQPEDFVTTFKGKNYVEIDKVYGLIDQMVAPFAEASAQRAAQRAANGAPASPHPEEEEGIDAAEVAGAAHSARQRP